MNDTNSKFEQAERPYRIAIVGAGPKGLYGLERLLANLSETPLETAVEIHVFNQCAFFGAGNIYRHDQPEYLLMNYANGFINVWPDQAPQPIVEQPLSFVDWLKAREDKVSGNQFSSRAKVGEYLCSAYEELKKRLPRNVRLLQHTQEVVDIEAQGGTFLLKTECEAYVGIQHVLMATGHPKPTQSAFYGSKGFVDFVYPMQERFANIQPDEFVTIKGMGLTFIDAAIALTEGRGGKFISTETGLVYEKLGQEPRKLYPFSKSGFPIMPRNGTFDLSEQPLHYFTPENLCHNKGDKAQFDFEKDILPLIKQETVYAYYRMLFQEYNQYLHPFKDFHKIESEIEAFHEKHLSEKPFSFHNLMNPFSYASGNRHQQVVDVMRNTIFEAEKGEEGSPLAHAAGTWRRVSNDFNELYSYGGLSPKSHEVFQREYAGQFNRLAYGPPVRNMKKVLALAEAGLIDFTYAESPTVSQTEEGFLLTTPDGTYQKVHHLVDARIPKIDMVNNPPKLYARLMEKGLARVFHNEGQDCPPFSPGCIEISREGHPIDTSGNEVKQITLTGTPTEGITFDNDTLSRNRNDFVSLWGKQVADDVQIFIQTNTQVTTQ